MAPHITQALGGLGGLQRLGVSQCSGVSGEGLLQLLPSWPALTHLNFSCLHLAADHIEALVKVSRLVHPGMRCPAHCKTALPCAMLPCPILCSLPCVCCLLDGAALPHAALWHAALLHVTLPCPMLCCSALCCAAWPSSQMRCNPKS